MRRSSSSAISGGRREMCRRGRPARRRFPLRPAVGVACRRRAGPLRSTCRRAGRRAAAARLRPWPNPPRSAARFRRQDGRSRNGPRELGRAAHHLTQLRLAQRRHVDQAMRGIERFVFLQIAEKVRPHAQHCPQTRVAERMRQDFGEAAALALLGAHVQLLALIDVEKEGRRLGLIQSRGSGARSRRAGPARWSLAVEKQLHPSRYVLDAGGIDRVELPGPEKRLDQSLDRLGARLEP